MQRKKLLYVTRPLGGGIAKHVEVLLSYFSKSWEIVLAAPSPLYPFSRLFNVEKGRYYPLPLRGDAAPLSDAKAFLRLLSICRGERPDLIHIHGYKAALVALPAARFSGCRAVVTVHNSLTYPEVSSLPEAYFEKAIRASSAMVDYYITVSEALRKELVMRGIAPYKIITVYNGVDCRNFEKAVGQSASNIAEFPGTLGKLKESRGLKIGTCGRLVPQKGMDLFIRAAALVSSKFPQARFFVAGDGPEKAGLEYLRDTLDLGDKLFFLGHVQGMSSFYDSLDLFVLPSRSEGLSIALLEAGASRLPVVAAATGGIPEIVQHGRTGLLVPPEEVQTLAGHICWLLAEPEKRRKMGLEAQKEVSLRFTEEKMVKETEDIYAGIMEEKVCRSDTCKGQKA